MAAVPPVSGTSSKKSAYAPVALGLNARTLT